MKHEYKELLNIESLKPEEMKTVIGGNWKDGEDLPVHKGKNKNPNFRRRKNKGGNSANAPGHNKDSGETVT